MRVGGIVAADAVAADAVAADVAAANFVRACVRARTRMCRMSWCADQM